MRFAVGLIVALPVMLCAQAQQAALRPEQQLAHDIYKELIEINTADSVGNTTAASTVARRFHAAGFPDADTFEGGPRPDKGNLIVRSHGSGTSGRTPLMLLAHLDVVQALKSDWSPDIDPFNFTERDGYYYGRGTFINSAGAAEKVSASFEVNRAFFTNTAKIAKPDMAAAMRAIVANPDDAKASETISADPRYRSMLRTTCVATMLNGGHARNALPQTATANVNCRMAPGHDPSDVRAALLKAANDTGVKISAPPAMEHAAPSPLSPEIMKPIEKVTRDVFGPNVLVIPTMGTGATDSKYLRAAGISGYGVSGLMGDPDDARAHGKDERVLIKSYYDRQDFLYRLVKELSSGKVVP